jgi:phosphopantothenoylcysteine decarboxylase / phosphopantothenate---cysteine ligase
MIPHRSKRVKMTDTCRYAGKSILLGVTGSIAAYKAVSLARRLGAEGAMVNVVMTHTAQRFVGPITFEVLTGRPVGTDRFTQGSEMAHLTLAESADLILIAPASAHCLAKLAHGLADDLLSTLILAATCPVVVAPAMDGGMWDHPAVRDNVLTLRRRGVVVLEPESGLLASGATGQGRLPGEDVILTAVTQVFVTHKDFQGRRILVTGGPTQEALDPVRFLSNRSSGKMGWA